MWTRYLGLLGAVGIFILVIGSLLQLFAVITDVTIVVSLGILIGSIFVGVRIGMASWRSVETSYW
ncbi:MAG: hypothetical protein ABEI06_09975 [Halobacteriaceae archaeon]